MVAATAAFTEVYVGMEYARAIALGEILEGFTCPQGFTDCRSGGNAIGSNVDPC